MFPYQKQARFILAKKKERRSALKSIRQGCQPEVIHAKSVFLFDDYVVASEALI
jgi:hypothetical protein